MAVNVRCPNAECGRVTAVPETYLGKKGRCPACKTAFILSADPETIEDGFEVVEADDNEAPPAESRPALKVPGHVGRFAVRALVARTAASVRYRADDPVHERPVLLTVFPVADADHRRRLLRALRSAELLRHPAILPVLEVIANESGVVAVAPWVDGAWLDDTLTGDPLKPVRAARLVRELAEGLAHAHDQGEVHRAVEPGNVLLDEDDRPHLTGFGEVPTSTDEATPAGDQFGLGVILYRMICGQSPFAGEADAPTPPRSLRRDLPRDLEAIVLKALASDPDDRYASCQQLADDLGRFLAGEPVTARKPGMGGRLGRSVRRSPGFAILAGFLVVAAGVAVVAGWFRLDSLRAEAERERTVAEQARRAAAEARERADQPSQEAGAKQKDRQQRDTAAAREREEQEKRQKKEAADKAEKDKKAAEKERTEREAVLYAQRVALSHRTWIERDVMQAERLLLAGVPAPKAADPRGWEWHYLDRLYRAPQALAFRSERPPIAVEPAKGGRSLSDRPYAVALSPDGQQIAVSLRDDQVSVSNHVTGFDPVILSGHKAAVCGVAFSPDGARIATAGADRSVIVWDAATGQSQRSLDGHDDAVLAVAFSPDGKTLATGSADKTVKLWDPGSGEERHTLSGHTDSVLHVALAPDGKQVASAGADGAARVWDAATGTVTHTLTGHVGPVYGVAFSPDGKRVATAGADRTVRLWEAGTGQPVRTFTGHARAVRAVAFHSDGQRLFSAGDDRTIGVWFLNGAPSYWLPTGHDGPVMRLALSADGRLLATAGADRVAKLWGTNRRADPPTFRGHTEAVNGVAVSSDGATVASAGGDNAVILWDAWRGTVTRSLDGHTKPVKAVAFHPKADRLATGGDDGTVKLWESKTGKLLWTQTEPGPTGVLSLCFSADGQFLVSGNADGTVHQREAASGQGVYTFKGHRKGVESVQFSPDGKRLFSVADDGTAILWDVDQGDEIRRFTGRIDPDRVTTTPLARARFKQGAAAAVGTGDAGPRAAFSPDGKQFAVVGAAGWLTLWDAKTCDPLRLLTGHDAPVRGCAYTPDSRRLVTADAAGLCKVWDTLTGEELLTFRAHDAAVNGVAVSPDGHRLYTAGADRFVRLWDGTPRAAEKP